MEMLQAFFMWCSIINIGLLLMMFGIILAAKAWAYKMHSRWFDLSPKEFDLMLYGFLGLYKLLVFVFNIVPWIALSIIG